MLCYKLPSHTDILRLVTLSNPGFVDADLTGHLGHRQTYPYPTKGKLTYSRSLQVLNITNRSNMKTQLSINISWATERWYHRTCRFCNVAFSDAIGRKTVSFLYTTFPLYLKKIFQVLFEHGATQ